MALCDVPYVLMEGVSGETGCGLNLEPEGRVGGVHPHRCTTSIIAATLARSANEKRSDHKRSGFMIRIRTRETKNEQPASQP